MKRSTLRLAIVTTAVVVATAFGGLNAAAASSPATGSAVGARQSDRTVTIYLTRHGRTILNQTDTVQGWSDSPLLVGTESFATLVNGRIPSINAGRPLARAVGKDLAADVGRFDAAYSADGKRHFETATYMLQGARQNLAVVQDAGLREVNFGRYEGKENEELWSAAVEHLGYVIDNTAGPVGCVTPGAPGQPCEVGGWQTMQGVAITHNGLYGMMNAIKAVADDPAHGLPAENCSDVDARMTASLKTIAQKAAKVRQRKILVVSSGLSILCFANAPGMRTVDGGIPSMPPAGVPNLGVTKVVYKNGVFAIDGPVGSTAYYPQP
jgi:probable phosphoglycerate mutase